ncbi:Retrovirus-related Pol polyprotein from transposon TNT 1-94, partial [Trametes pubescens]
KCTWSDWKWKIETICDTRDVLGHLDGTTPIPVWTPQIVAAPAAQRTTPADPDTEQTPVPPTMITVTEPTDEFLASVKAWTTDDKWVKMLLTWNICIKSRAGIVQIGKTAAEVWHQLAARFEASSALDRINLVRKLEATKFAVGSDINEHVGRMCQLWQEATEAGASVPASDFSVHLVNSMPVAFEPIFAHLLGNTNFEYVMSQMKALYMNSVLRAGIATNIGPGATSMSNTGQSNTFVARSSVTCEWCGWTGHTRDRCYCPGGGLAGKQPSTWKSDPRPKRGSACDLAIQAKLATLTIVAPTPTASVATVVSPPADDGPSVFDGWADPQRVNAFVVTTEDEQHGELRPILDPTVPVKAYADSGASHHYFVDRRHFSNYRTVTPMHGNAAKKGATFQIIGVGDINAVMVIDNRESLITLKEVLHAPDLAANLISVARIDRGGCNVQIRDGSMAVYPNSDLANPCLTGNRTTGDLYEVVFKRIIIDRNDQPSACLTSTKADLATWHRRLGHPREQTIRNMVRGGAVKGLEIIGKPPAGKCTDCIRGKQTRASFYPATVETEVGERVYIDVMFFNVQSLGGGDMLFTYDDGATSFLVGYVCCTKTQEEAVETLETYHRWMERQTGKELKILRTDNGGEFINKTWEAYTRKTGLHHEPTTPKNPEQNGLSERGHRTIGERTRTMLADSRLPEYLWAWVKIPDDTHKKLDPKSRRGFMVGYTEDASYRIWVPQEGGPMGRVIRSRDVVFEEGPSHRTLTPAGDMDLDGFELPGNSFVKPDREPDSDNEDEEDEPKAEAPEEKEEEAEEKRPERELGQGEREWAMDDPVEEVRRSTREAKPSRAMEESREYQERERKAQQDNQPWAKTAEVAVDARYVAMLTATDLEDMSTDEVPDNLEGGTTPQTLREALKTPEIWKPAMQKEMGGLMGIEAWKLVPRRPEMNVVGCKWAYARKFDAVGRWKPKARLVAKGFHQIPGIDYFESHASVVRFESLRIICALATYRGMEMGQDDIEKAYLNTVPQNTVYMQQPPGYVDEEHPDWVCQLQRSLYGLMHSGNDWWKDLDATYGDLGFERSRADECVRARFDQDGLAITATYTDDITSCADSKPGLTQVRTDIAARYKISGGGEFKYMLGVAVERDMARGTMRLTQRAYAERVLERFRMHDCNPVGTPLEPGLKLPKDGGAPTTAEEKEMEATPYHEGLGALMYLAVATRLDLAHTVQYLSRFMVNPGYSHWKALKRAFRYLKGTLDHGITFYDSSHPGSALQPVIYSDSSYADCIETARSTHGHITIMAGGPVTWSSRRQDVVTLSSTEAEYIAAVHAGQTAMWIAKFLDKIYLPAANPIVIRIDSSGAESLARRLANFTRVRHLRVREFWLRDVVRDGGLVIERVPGTANPADMLTKALGPTILKGYVERLGLAPRL